MLSFSWIGRAVALAGVVAHGACGDNFSTGVFTQMEVVVDSETFQDEAGTVFFAPGVQLPVFKDVTVFNTGTRELTISKIDWAVDPDTGRPLRNPHIEIDWRGGVDANSFPWTVDTSNVNALGFAVKYTPPNFGPPESLEDSVLEIHTNARTTDGRGTKPIVRITFSLRANNAMPRVTPTNYRFTNATTARPESQDFRIYNDDGASASFRVLSVRLENPSDVFRLSNLPSQGAEVPAPADAAPGFDGFVFTCTYTPLGGTNDSNAILIETDLGSNATLRVSLTTGTNPGSYSLSFDHPSEFDFTTTSVNEVRNVMLSSDGPGPITFRQPRIEPEEARRNFSFRAFVPATQQGQADTEITQWPRGVNVGRTIRLEITFAPEVGGGDTANGELIVPYENPNPGSFTIPLFSGEPKGRLVVAPPTGTLAVTGSVVAGDSGTRHAILYNEGNGTLQIESLEVTSNLAVTPPPAARVWSLPTPVEEVDIPPNGLLVVPLDYDLGEIDTFSGSVTELLRIHYFNDFTGTVEERVLGLNAANIEGLTNPTANPGTAADYAGATVGSAVSLNGSGSSAGSGQFASDSFVWFLVEKPAGSAARLNVATAGPATFVPDLPGDYTVELLVFAQADNSFIYSAPARVTISVAEAAE